MGVEQSGIPHTIRSMDVDSLLCQHVELAKGLGSLPSAPLRSFLFGHTTKNPKRPEVAGAEKIGAGAGEADRTDRSGQVAMSTC